MRRFIFLFPLTLLCACDSEPEPEREVNRSVTEECYQCSRQLCDTELSACHDSQSCVGILDCEATGASGCSALGDEPARLIWLELELCRQTECADCAPSCQ